MELLIATHALAGLAGAPLHTLDICRGFRRAGHHVSVFTLEPGMVSDMLREEGFPLFSLQDYRALAEEPFDLVYLHSATCEALLGLVFAGRVPLVRDYIGKGSSSTNPIGGSFLSGATYISEGVREAMMSMPGHHNSVPSIIARNVYDDRQVVPAKHPGPVPEGSINFAVVTNHFDPDLAGLLESGTSEGLCSFTHFGHPHNSVPVTQELLTPFDAVITIGRTVLLAAAMGKPVYICDIRGSDGWLTRENYQASRYHSFSGRRFANKDWDVIRGQLLYTDQWPDAGELRWVCEQIERDHALSRRIGQLEAFFAEIIERAPEPVPSPDGYMAVCNFILKQKQGASTRTPGDRYRRQEIAEARRVAEQTAKEKTEKIRRLKRRLRRQRRRARELESQLEAGRGPGS